MADLPWQGAAVQLRLYSRHFRCLHATCPQRIFCERLPGVVAPYGRCTFRLDEALHLIGFASGGEASARLACRLGMRVSPDTLWRGVRRRSCTVHPTPCVLGVDDWTLRKGHHYGALLVDLERRRPFELLADREAVTLAVWLKTHLGVEMISCDRAPKYAEAAREAAPYAMQVADRWHLLKNMGNTVQRFMTGKQELVEQGCSPGDGRAAVGTDHDPQAGGHAPIAECEGGPRQSGQTVCAAAGCRAVTSAGGFTEWHGAYPRDQPCHRPQVHPGRHLGNVHHTVVREQRNRSLAFLR